MFKMPLAGKTTTGSPPIVQLVLWLMINDVDVLLA